MLASVLHYPCTTFASDLLLYPAPDAENMQVCLTKTERNLVLLSLLRGKHEAKEERRRGEEKVGKIYLIEQKAGETTSDKSSLASEKLAVSNKNVVELVTFCPNKG